MKKSFYPQFRSTVSAALVCMLLLIFYSCDDSGIEPPDRTVDVEIDKFLHVPSGSPHALQRIAEAVKEQNLQHPFIDKLIKTDGFAVWDKSILEVANTDTASKMVLVPLLPKQGKSVNSILVCRITPVGVQIRLLRAKEYRAYDYSGKLDRPSAESISSLFMIMSHRVLGTTEFRLTDKKLFYRPEQKGEQFITLSRKATSESARTAETIIIPFVHCYELLHNGNKGNLVSVKPGNQVDYPYNEGIVCDISVIVYDIPDYTPIEPGSGTTPGGNSGNPNGGTSGSGDCTNCLGDGWYSPPCGDASNPCPVESGWEPVPESPDANDEFKAFINFVNAQEAANSSNAPVPFPMTPEEEWAVKHPVEALLAKINADYAKSVTRNMAGKHNGVGDAFRHALWTFSNTVQFGYAKAITLGYAHEASAIPRESKEEQDMDISNNFWGANYAIKNPWASVREFTAAFNQALANGEIVTIEGPRDSAYPDY